MITLDFQGLKELIDEVERISGIEKEKVDKRILEKCGKLTLQKVENKIHKSKDNSKSGRKGSRPPGHAAKNVPLTSVKRNKYGYYIIVGWDKSDNSPYYYMKFEEWGTSKRKPHATFEPTAKELDSEYSKIAEEEYQNLLNKLK